MFEIIKKGTKIDFIGWSKIYFIASIVACIISVGLIVSIGFNYGVDFSGGTVVQVQFEKAPSLENMREVLNKAIDGKVAIQNFGEANDYLVRAEQTDGDLQKIADDIQGTLLTAFPEAGNVEIQRVEQVGPQVGSELKTKALMALLYSMVGILIYIAIRFELLYSFGAILSLIHDILIMLGVLVLFKVDFDLTVLAAVLTVVGYSLNDTIVIFDRIRERSKSDSDKPLMQIMNMSINETLSRTILTSFLTLLAVISLYLFGGEVINAFAFTLLVGILVGTYSSIGVASASVYMMKKVRRAK